MVYLQDNTTTLLNPLNTSISSGFLSYLCARPLKSKTSNAKPAVTISLASINEAGLFLHTLYPPIDQGHRITRGEVLPSGSSTISLDCVGPENKTFYSIFAGKKGPEFAMRVEVQWRSNTEKSYQVSFCRSFHYISGTALELFHNTQIGWDSTDRKSRDWAWKEYYNTRPPRTSKKGHIRMSKTQPGNILASTYTDCSLDWVPGHHVQDTTTVRCLHRLRLHVLSLHLLCLHVLWLHALCLHVLCLHVLCLHVLCLRVLCLHVLVASTVLSGST
jgi:hypothetical protein